MKQTQWAKINAYLKTHKDASLRELNDAANANWAGRRISEMREAGVDIRDYWVEAVDADGYKTRYKRYYMG